MQTLFERMDPDPEKQPEKAVLMSVMVPYPVDKAYSYMVPEGMALQPGDYVSVPLGVREVPGVVWGISHETVPAKKLKSILARHSLPPMPQVQRDFIDWVAQYTMTPAGSVLKMALSVPAALEAEKAVTGYALSELAESMLLPSPHGGEGRVRGIADLPNRLRQNQTEAEKKLWSAIRDRRLENLKFKRQFPIPPYIADFACSEKKLVIELDGGQHDEQSGEDRKRADYIESHGYRILRFWNNDLFINFDGVLETIVRVANELPSWNIEIPLTPALSPMGRGGSDALLNNLSPARRRVLEVLGDGVFRRASELAERASCSTAIIKGLYEKGLLKVVEIFPRPPCSQPEIHSSRPVLSVDQAASARHLRELVQKGEYRAALVDGVTGAGKTEVYFEAVAEALEKERQVLILLPEIALSNAFLDRFRQRFGCAPALWHSSLSPAQRRRTWRGVAEGKTKVVVGARSALFLPYRDLGLIVVDEEHDPAYKQEDGVIYHARDMAVVRAHLSKIPAVLVSATPSLETIVNAWSGRYDHLHLPDRHGGATLPDIRLLDLREDKPERQHFIAPALRRAMGETLARGEQVLLFLNRRGYAPLTLCRTCGHRMECPRCTAWLVEHRAAGRLQCHHCGYFMPFPKQCVSCGDEDSLAACGPGVERIHDEVRAYFPDARTMVLASDTAESNDQLRIILDDIRERRIDIVIGTQIIAKGHHFPGLTLVGVIDADLGLGGGDLRAAERTYQLLHQVAGRAGREDMKGTVYLQTWMPGNRVMQALAGIGRDAFLDVEAREREKSHMPPYTRLAGIIVSGRNERQVDDIAKALGKTAPQGADIKTLGPAPAPFYRLRGDFRRRLLIQADKAAHLQKVIDGWVAGIKIPSTVRVQIDIDPQSFL
jgi:primosomal protein N' (replication factor Y)